ncbi:SRPBCC family protein [Mycolicibacterium moriokaense]|nr:SRPBCC family protein [Mycolicibacterium moriokaense]
MADVSRSRTIAAPPQAIWDVLADFGSLSSWAEDVDHSSILRHGPDGPLATSRRVQIGRNTIVEQIIDFDPPVTLAYRISGLPTRVHTAVNRWTLSPQSAATTVTLTSTIGVDAGPLSGAVEKLVCRGLARQSDRLLAGLAHRLEHPNDR